jgi:hypothetical protein
MPAFHRILLHEAESFIGQTFWGFSRGDYTYFCRVKGVPLFSVIFATGLRQRSSVNIGALHNIAVFNVGGDATCPLDRFFF